jgi:hypothetical protein
MAKVKVLSVDIEIGRINLLISTVEKGRVLSIDSTTLEMGEITEITAKVKEYMYQRHFSGKIIVTLSDEMVVSRFFRLPVVSDKKINQMVPFQIEGSTILGNNQILYAWSASKYKSYSNVIVDVVNRTKFEEVYKAIVPIAPQFVTTSVAVLNSYDVKDNVCFIDIGYKRSYVYFSDNGSVNLSAVSFWGVEKLDELIMQHFGLSKEDAETFRNENKLLVRDQDLDTLTLDQKNVVKLMNSSVMDLVNDLKRIILSYRLKNNRPIDRMILLGLGSSISNISELLSSCVSIRSGPLIADGRFAKAHLMALAIFGKKRMANFLKGEYALGASVPFYSIFFIFNRALVLSIIVTFFILIGYIGNFISYSALKKEIMTEIARPDLKFDENTKTIFATLPMKAIREISAGLATRQQQVDKERKLIENYQKDRMQDLVFVAQSIPAEIPITAIKVEGGKVSVRIQGKGEELKNLEAKLKNIKGSVTLQESSLTWEY